MDSVKDTSLTPARQRNAFIFVSNAADSTSNWDDSKFHFTFSYLTVCKSCLVKHYDESNICPNWSCGKIINLMHGTKVFRSDPGIQSIVNKVVPNLVHGMHLPLIITFLLLIVMSVC